MRSPMFEIKSQGRRLVHNQFAYLAVYRDSRVSPGVPTTARLHAGEQVIGELRRGDGSATILDEVTAVILDLPSLPSRPRANAIIEFPEWKKTFKLGKADPSDDGIFQRWEVEPCRE